MERAGTTVRGGYRADDLAAVAGSPGPFGSVWLGRSGLGAYGHTTATRADGVRRELVRLGTPDGVADELADAVGSGTTPGVVAIADHTGLRLREVLDTAPRRDVVRWSAVPAWCAVIEHRQAQIPVIVVLADRLGADVLSSSAHGEDATSVDGADDPVTKSAPGGWSQKRFQQRAENTWEHNAALVVDEIVRASRSLQPELVVLGGDGRAVQAILDRMPKELSESTHTIAGGRAADGSEDRRVDDVGRLVRTAVAEQTVGLLQRLAAEDGQGARAANGPAATFDALARHQVDVLLVHDDAGDERQAWWAPASGAAALDRERLTDLDPGGPHLQDRLADVAVAGALRAGAAIRVVPDAAAVHDGIAALLRW